MSVRPAFTLALATVLWLGGCASQPPLSPPVALATAPAHPVATGQVIEAPAAAAPEAPPLSDEAQAPGYREIERGRASWYGARFQGRRTASGEAFNMHDFTAAHKTLPFGTQVLVRHMRTGLEVVVRINDRGPFTHGRVIDVSRAAAERIGMVRSGAAPVVLLVR